MTVWTIGHSNHTFERLVDLLRAHDVEVVADVRSQPYSRRNPHFGRERLRAGLAAAGIGYVFLGAELGGRPPEPELYDAGGHVRYAQLATRPRFRAGLARLEDGARGHRVAMLCSEEDPARCHRRLLVAPALIADGVAVVHIRGDGTASTEPDGPGNRFDELALTLADEAPVPAAPGTRARTKPAARARASSRRY